MTGGKTVSEPMNMAYDSFIPSKDEDITLPPVFLLHSMISSRKTWQNIPQKIADATKRKVYALDSRNHGDSDWSERFDYDIMAKDVEKFMCDANISKAVLVGHSQGGKVAMVFAFSWPEKVDKLVLEDISPKVQPPLLRRFPLYYIELVKGYLSKLPQECDVETAKERIAKFLESDLPKDHLSKKKSQNACNNLSLKMTEKGVALKANIDVIENAYLNNPQFAAELRGMYNGETLFIYGTESKHGVGDTKDKILQQFPRAVFSAVENASHLVHLDFPDEFCVKVMQFIGIK